MFDLLLNFLLCLLFIYSPYNMAVNYRSVPFSIVINTIASG